VKLSNLAKPAQILYNLTFAQRVQKHSGEQSMAQVCEICGKKPMSGNTISHAHNVSKRRWNINLRPVHAKVGATTKRMRVCTSCLRSGKVVKA
jgi:large subunit ribosomal protein L28